MGAQDGLELESIEIETPADWNGDGDLDGSGWFDLGALKDWN